MQLVVTSNVTPLRIISHGWGSGCHLVNEGESLVYAPSTDVSLLVAHYTHRSFSIWSVSPETLFYVFLLELTLRSVARIFIIFNENPSVCA